MVAPNECVAYWRTQSAPSCARIVCAFPGPRGSRGFTLVEVLVAALLTTTSVLGLARLLVAALAIPDVKERLTVLGADGVGDTPQHFSAFIKADIAKWSKVVKAAGIKVE